MISTFELAKRCGVSQGTVDRALHNRSGISPKTKERILAEAEKMGYRANPATWEILSGKSKVVGILTPDITSSYMMDLANAIRRELLTVGMRCYFAQASDRQDLIDSAEDFASRRMAAVILLAPPPDLELPEPLVKNSKVIAMVQPLSQVGIINAVPNEYAIGTAGTQHLIDLGHKNLLHLSFRNKTYANVERTRGFTETASQAGCTSTVLENCTAEELVETVRDKNITGIFAHNDWRVLSAVAALGQESFQVPGQIGVVGVDDSPSFNALAPNISTVPYPYEWCAKVVFNKIRGKKAVPPEPSYQVIRRQTT